MRPIVPNLWFDTEAEEAVAFYVGLFPDSRVVTTVPYGPEGPGPEGSTMLVVFELNGQRFTAINGGPQFPFTEAVSFEIPCADQDEVDRLWAALTADGGEEGQCGWCKDRYGLSWQVVPDGLEELMRSGDPERVRRATRAMFGMRKLDIAALRVAADGVTA